MVMSDPARLPDESWRCFVAVPIGDDLRERLTALVADLRRQPWANDWRWTDAETWHITLAFLGWTSPSRVPQIVDELGAIALQHPAFSVPSGGLGAFPSRRRARVLWYGVDDPEGKLAALAADVRSALQVEGEDPLRAHITLGRAKDRASFPTAAGSADGAGPDVSITDVRLVRSHIPGKPRYTVLAMAPLPQLPQLGRGGSARDLG